MNCDRLMAKFERFCSFLLPCFYHHRRRRQGIRSYDFVTFLLYFLSISAKSFYFLHFPATNDLLIHRPLPFISLYLCSAAFPREAPLKRKKDPRLFALSLFFRPVLSGRFGLFFAGGIHRD